jgi:hypothetical protein
MLLVEKAREELLAALLKEKSRLRDCIDGLSYQIKAMEGDRYFYKVILVSLWNSEGEKDAHGASSVLAQALRVAERNFRAVNNRSDVQASASVFLVFPDMSEFYIGKLKHIHTGSWDWY